MLGVSRDDSSCEGGDLNRSRDRAIAGDSRGSSAIDVPSDARDTPGNHADARDADESGTKVTYRWNGTTWEPRRRLEPDRALALARAVAALLDAGEHAHARRIAGQLVTTLETYDDRAVANAIAIDDGRHRHGR